ncbi:MAG: hypothetical protein JSR30_00020 [Proteobacteria bacterium]|nr:hypothetical protein [Pseudomonadota bacterium]
MKKLALFVVAVAGLSTAGCLSSIRLPAIEGQQVTYHRTDPIGGTTIEARNVRVTDQEVTAEHLSWSTTYPQFTFQITVDGYRRARTPADK